MFRSVQLGVGGGGGGRTEQERVLFHLKKRVLKARVVMVEGDSFSLFRLTEALCDESMGEK